MWVINPDNSSDDRSRTQPIFCRRHRRPIIEATSRVFLFFFCVIIYLSSLTVMDEFGHILRDYSFMTWGLWVEDLEVIERTTDYRLLQSFLWTLQVNNNITALIAFWTLCVIENGDSCTDSSRAELGFKAWWSEGARGFRQRLDINRVAARLSPLSLPGYNQDW